MNKLLQTALISAILSTGLMAQTTEPLLLEGSINMEGGEFQISKNDYKLTGNMDFHMGGKLTIDANRTLEVNGGHIMSDHAGMGVSEFTLNGILRLTKGGDDGTQMPNLMFESMRLSSGTSEIIDTFSYSADGQTYIVKIPEIGLSIKSGDFVATKYKTTQTILTDDIQNTALGDNQTESNPNETEVVIIIENEDSSVWIKKGKITESEVGEEPSLYKSSAFYWTNTSSDSKEQLIEVKSLTEGEGYDYYEKLDLSKFVQNGGLIDMSTLREYTSTLENDATEPTNLGVNGVNPIVLGTVKLPFNCSFGICDLSNVDKVEYTKLTVGESSAPGLEPLMDGEGENAKLKYNYIKKIVLKEGQVYGDYLTNKELGITLTTKNAEITEKMVDGDVTSLELEKLQKDTYEVKDSEDNQIKFNAEGTTNRLWTDDLNVVAQDISANTTYNFGFSGSKAVNISGEGKAIFKGNNTEYEPDEMIGVPNEVEFVGNNTLFQFSQNYGHGIFSKGSENWASNTVPENKTIAFSNGFDITSGCGLRVRGKLIG